ncbi:MAG: sigma-70 family RNA polymerase sigma factor, partial [Oscillospiraceae bacterium]
MQLQTYEEQAKSPYSDLWQLYSKTKSVDIRNKLIVEYSPLVKRIAQKTIGNYQYFNFLDDIVNEGIIALMDAVEKFDCRKNVKFETFASIKVKGAMIDFIRKQDCFPRRIKKIAKNIINAEGELSNDLNRNPTQQELASYMGVTIAELEKMQLEVYSLNIASFEQVVFE